MNPSSTLISDLRNAVYKDDERFTVIMGTLHEPEFKIAVLNLRESVIDFFVLQVDPEKIDTPDMFDRAVTTIKSEYYRAMITLLIGGE